VLRDISAQTGRATSAPTSSISKLSELASQLRQTVAGFRLPGGGRQEDEPAPEDEELAGSGAFPRLGADDAGVAAAEEVAPRAAERAAGQG